MALDEVGVSVIADMSDYDSNMQSAIDLASQLPDEISTTITADIEEPDISSLTELEDSQFDVTVTPDVADSSELTDLESLDGETLEPTVKTEVDKQDEVIGLLQKINARERFEMFLDIAGNAVEFLKKIESFTVAPFLDVEDAVARINAQTGKAIPGLDDMIRNIQFSDLGESVDQIADVVIQAQQLSAPIDDASRAALTFTHTFKDQNPVDVLTTMNTMVQTGLVPNFSAASDLLTTMFQEGNNKGGDLLNTINANAQSWKDMGLQGQQSASVINSLLDNNVDSASDAAKMLQTLDDALTNAAADANSPAAQALQTLGVDNPKEKGQAMGADFINGFADAFTNLPSDQQDLVSGVLFGKGGKKFTGALEGITAQGGPFADIVGAAEEAASEIDDSLRGAIDDFVLMVNETLSELLSSKAIDLPGKIDALKKGFQEALDVLAGGGTVGEAIEVGLNIPGFNDSVQRFEASVGNFAISILEIVAGIQDFLGKDSGATRRQITQAERQQLPFNLKVANADEIAGELQTAVDRGLSTSDIAKATGTAIDELISGGDLDKAQVLIDGLKDLQTGPPILAPNLNGQQISEATAALREGDTARIQEQIDKGNLIASVSIDTDAWQGEIDKAQEALKQSMLTFGPSLPQTNPLGPFGLEQGAKGANPFTSGILDPGGATAVQGVIGSITSAAETVAKQVTDTRTAVEDLDRSTTTATENVATNWDNLNISVSDATAAVIDATENTALKVEDFDTRTATSLTGNTVTASFDAVALSAATNFATVIQWLDKTIVKINQIDASAALLALTYSKIASLATAVQEFPFGKLQAIVTVATGFAGAQNIVNSGGNTTNNNNVTVNNNVQNTAQAQAGAYALGQSLGGG